MKYHHLFPIYLLSRIILLNFLFFMVACHHQETEAQQRTGQKDKAPEMDIHTAALTGNLEIIKKHIQAGTNLNQKEPMVASTPLIIATVFGKTKVAKALIEAGAEIDYQNKEGSTALHTAAFFCRTEILKKLLEKGANKNLKNKYGATPLESVQGPFQDVKGVYEMMNSSLGQMGLRLDYSRLEATRPKIAALLK